MSVCVKRLIQLVVLFMSVAGGALTANALPVMPASYDMPNGSGVSVGGEYNYWDANYTGNGNRTLDGARGSYLSGGLGKLTDGVIATESWEWTDSSGVGHTQQNLEGTGPYVGWTWGDPTITFHFADRVNIDSVTFFVDNPANDIYGNPRGGVTAPKSFTIDGLVHDVSKPSPGLGPMAITIAALDRETVNDLTVTINRDISPTMFWVFLSEVTFDDGRIPTPVPEPGSILLVGGGLVGLYLWRRRAA